MGVVTYPFSFEGRRRGNQAVEGIESLRDAVDSVIVIPNDRLLEVSGDATALQDAFSLADDVLRQGVQVGFRAFVLGPVGLGQGLQGCGRAWGGEAPASLAALCSGRCHLAPR